LAQVDVEGVRVDFMHLGLGRCLLGQPPRRRVADLQRAWVPSEGFRTGSW
jgi:hypothetical protein